MADPSGTSTTDRIKELFVELSELPHVERAQALDRECKEDAALRMAVESLLAADQHAGEFLAGPTAGGPSLRAAEREGKPPRQTIGPYKLLQVIGEGGFGSVYLAEQDQPVRRRVALKLIKLGMDTAEVIARFDVERQALAMMDHPGIAKVFDAGATDTGRPYFVMELVRGMPIKEYCHRHDLDIRARLRLFAEVCGAVQHAHTKGVIHRDLKPSNILVSTQDDRPCAKIIDFGIAKATQARLTDKTLFTEYHQFIGSPEYMSPEQAEGSLDIDTRSDVYSLGAMLYELLTGTTPLDMRELRTKTHAQIQQAIREVEPPKPSTRVGLLDYATGQRATAAIIRGELDWICMKAMEKDRARRYETAAALGADIGHYLNDEPVSAARPSRTYLLRKFARRNRTMVAASIAVFVALLAGVLATGIALISQAKQRAIADRERAVAKAVANFQSDMLSSADPAKALGGKVTVLDAMTAARAALDAGKLKGQPLVEAAVRHTIGLTLRSLGQFDAAEIELRRSLALNRAQLPPTDPAMADPLNELGLTLREKGNIAEAEPLLRQALEIRRSALAADDPDLATNLNNVALILHDQGKYDEAVPFFRESLAIRKKAFGAQHERVAEVSANLGATEFVRGNTRAAEQYMRDALAIDRAVLPPNHPTTATLLANLAAMLVRTGKLDEAATLARESLDIRRIVLPKGHAKLAQSLTNLAAIQQMRGARAEALPLFREALEIRRQTLPPAHPDLANTLNNFAALLGDLNRNAEAESYYREALDIQRRSLPPGHLDIAWTCNQLGMMFLAQGRLDEAEALLKESLAIRRAALPADHPDVALGKNSLAGLYRARGKFAEAESLYRESIATYQSKLGSQDWHVGAARVHLGRVLRQMNRFAESESELLQAEQVLAAPNTPAGRHDLALVELVTLYDRWNRSDPSPQRAAELARWTARQAATRPTTQP